MLDKKCSFVIRRIFNGEFYRKYGTKKNIPTPQGLPLIGTTLSLLWAGSMPKAHWYIDKRHKQLGPIFRERLGPADCVFISDPQMIRTVFANEGQYPLHVLPEIWTIYNRIHNVTRGIFFMDGTEWLHYRRILNPLLLKGDKSWIEDSCRPAINSIIMKIKDFVEKSKPKDYLEMEELLYKLSLNVIVAVLIGAENYINSENQLETRINKLASIVKLVFQTSSKLALIPGEFAAKYKISRWRKFESAVTEALNSAAYLTETLLNDHLKKEDGLLIHLKKQMNVNEMVKIVTDLILAAGDTTANATIWTLYLLSKNVDVQNHLRQEIHRLQNDSKKISESVYLKHVIKESLRLYPIAPFLTRIAPDPITIKDYEIPAGTLLILSIFTTGRDENIFDNPLQFNPNRWIRDGVTINNLSRLASVPFAMGTRSCIGKKLAEIQLQLSIAEVIRNFHVRIDNKRDVEPVLEMVMVPDEKIKFKFVKVSQENTQKDKK